MPKQVLIVDDDAHIREVIQFALEKAGMKTAQAADGKEALDIGIRLNPDLIILDINMPEMDGIEFCREFRKRSETPILFLSSRSDEVDRIIGLEIGGDDYVTKPFSPRELVARVNAILKRTKEKHDKPKLQKNMKKENVQLDTDRHEAFYKDKIIPLTATEFSLLSSFFNHTEKVYSRDDLMENSYAYNINVSDRTIDSHIRRIRAKYASAGCNSVIETVHGVGYKLGSCQ